MSNSKNIFCLSIITAFMLVSGLITAFLIELPIVHSVKGFIIPKKTVDLVILKEAVLEDIIARNGDKFSEGDVILKFVALNEERIYSDQLVAPFDGYVQAGADFLYDGQVVGASTSLLSYSSNKRVAIMELELDWVNLIHPGDEVSISITGTNEIFKSSVYKIKISKDEQTGEQSYWMTALVDENEVNVGTGFTAEILSGRSRLIDMLL